MDSQPDRTADGAVPSPVREPWWEASYRWLGWIGGVAVLAMGFADWRGDFGSDHVGRSLYHLGLVLSGILLLAIWVLELFEWRSGKRIMTLRRKLVPLLFATSLLFLAAGLAWLLGH
jgi:hypothetical protein